MPRGKPLALDFGVVEPADAPVAVDAPLLVPEIPFTWSEQHRHACEVRYCVARGCEWTVEFCRGVADKRGRDAAKQLWRDAKREAGWLKH